MNRSWIQKFFYPTDLSTPMSIALLILRLVAGTAFLLHGWGKIQNPFGWMGPDANVPGIFQALAAFSEFGGGLAWILGLLSSLASLGMLFTMSVAVHFHAILRGDPFVNPKGASYELALVYLVISLLFILGGPGKFSLDQKLFGKKS